MEKLDMRTPDFTDDNIARIAELFPNCVTEAADGKKAIDFDLLRQELSANIIEGSQERYRLDWPGKRQALALANTPINKTLRPCRAESVDFDTTENLFIEGDNLDALKLLQENYLGKIKMIYIDPPYNRGSDLVYKDNFKINCKDYLEGSGQFSNEGRLYSNTESNGRFHSEWLSMIYSRLKLTRNLLCDNGLIFISINDYELSSLHKLCSEIFGEKNYIATLIWDKNHSAQAGIYKVYHEYVLLFCKNIDLVDTPKSIDSNHFEAGAMKKPSGRHAMQAFTFPKGTRFDAPDGTELIKEWGDVERVRLKSGRMVSENGRLKFDVTLEAAFTQIEQMRNYFYVNKSPVLDSRGQKIIEFYFSSTGKIKVIKERAVETPQTTLRFGSQGPTSIELAELFETDDPPFDAPKPIDMIKDFVQRFTEEDDIVLDYFAGSATTSHSIIKINSEFVNSNRKFILVQIPENLDESLACATKDGKKTLETAIKFLDKQAKPHLMTEISKERIRRAGAKIKTELAEGIAKEKAENPLLEQEDDKRKSADDLDIGFRVLKIDSSNMEDVYYQPDKLEQNIIEKMFIDNIKPDRTAEDLLFQVMLDWGTDLLTKPIIKEVIQDNEVFFVDGDALAACFANDGEITEDFCKELAQRKPLRVVFRDGGFKEDSVKINIEQIFKLMSPHTDIKTI